MEQNFQTSFIPKKPMVEEHVAYPRPISLLAIIAVFILFTVLLATGGLFFYKTVASKNLKTMANNLTIAQNRFEPAKIKELQVLDKRLTAADEILSKHVAVTPIFVALQGITMKSVRFTKFDYALDDTNTKVNVKLSGVALGYSNLALQSDLFTKNKNFIDPIFSNITLNEKGQVIFDLSFSVDPTFIDYKNTLVTNPEPQTAPVVEPGT